MIWNTLRWNALLSIIVRMNQAEWGGCRILHLLRFRLRLRFFQALKLRFWLGRNHNTRIKPFFWSYRNSLQVADPPGDVSWSNGKPTGERGWQREPGWVLTRWWCGRNSCQTEDLRSSNFWIPLGQLGRSLLHTLICCPTGSREKQGKSGRIYKCSTDP